MQRDRSRVRALAGAAWLLSLALACADDPYCAPQDDCAALEEALESSFNDEEAPCDSLSDGDCQRSGRCIVDSVCRASTCSGPGCADSCELVRACVPY